MDDSMKVCSVIVAAWHAERWIGEMIEGFNRQKPLSSWKYNLLIGVDGCETTSAELRRIKQPHMWSEKNVGTYIMRNSLMQQLADAYAIFDADDVMLPDYLFSMLPELANGIIGGARRTINENGRAMSAKGKFMRGVCIISKQALAQLGGYRADRIAADSDLVLRAKMLNIRTISHTRIVYFRRRLPTSLTQMPETGFKSAARKAIVMKHRRLREAGELFVAPVTTRLEWRI